MRYLTKLVLMVLLLLPVSVWAAECSVKGNENFDITIKVPNYNSAQTYTVYYQKQGNKDPVLIWSNKSTVDGDSPVIYESSFVDGLSYQIKFFYDSSASTITYYHKQESDEYWSEGETRSVVLDNGQSFFVADHASEDDLNCDSGEVTPPEPKPDVDICTYFNEPAQSWKSGSGAFFGSNQNNAETNYHLGGWTRAYTSQYESSFIFGGSGEQKLLSIPFDQLTASRANVSYQASGSEASGRLDVTYEDAKTFYLTDQFDSGYDEWNYYGSCNGRECRIASGEQPVPPKVETPDPISPQFTSTKSLIIGPWNFDSECPVDGSSPYCKSTINGDVRTIEILSDINNLQINGASGNSRVELKFNPTTPDSEYGIKIKEFNVTTGNVDVVFDEDGTYTFDIFHLSVSTASITIDAKILFKIKTLFQLSNSVPLTQLALPENFVIYGPDAIVDFAGGNKFYYGMFLAENIQFNNPITFYGSVTTNNLILPNDNTIVGLGACIDPQPSTSYTLDVTPDNQFALLCEAPEITFTVLNDDDSIATDYDGTITANYPTGLTPLAPTTGTQNSEYVYTPNQGKVVVPVEATSLQKYTVNAELTDDSDASDSGNVLFGPYKFSAEPVKAVAGHPTQFDVQVLACKDDEATVVEGYNGDKDLTVSEINLTKPTASDGAVDGGLEVSATQSGGYSSSDVTLNFSDDAKSQAYLRYNESGSLNFTLTDPEFVCPPEYDGCEVTNDDGTPESITSLQGIVNVDVRPWTFAICDENGGSDLPNGNSDGGDKFIAAGDKFSLQVKPIVWQDGGSLTGDIDVSGYCNATVTQNFLLSNAQPATVLMASTLATPTQGRLGSGIQADEGGSLERAHDAVSNSGDDHYTYTDLTWQEVGSLNITADINSDDYLGMNINLGYREIGRFYPHHFRLENDNVWDYADGHHDFAYMNQPIPMDYRVKAKSATDSDTENYGYFDETLQAAFAVEAIEKEVVFGNEIDGDSLNNRISQGPNQADNTWDKATYEFDSNDFMFLKILLNSSPYLSVPDGPYNNANSAFGVAVDTSNSVYTNDDQVNFNEDFVSTDTFTAPSGLDNLGVTFMHQPNFRYGRMVLDAVSGPISGPISVPLRVEYWNESSFVVNTDDNGSQFKTDVYYVMSNVENSGAKLTSTASSSFITVENGKSSRVQATQRPAQREQVRLFLRQGNDSGGYGNNSEPEDDDSLNATNDGWKNPEDIDQPWLQFNWRDKGDEDPSTVVNFGAYRGNDRIIFRGESNLTGK
ncbi:DUF6701 domain-containing protein [Vibrio sp. CK2-1]|uniref:DUF6701 domain-containing protein n=1 Tax=Vibrio sp. CK2-1 TaxID=2912249 RepID=UPI001F392083|nr:DUF6701 domain-containing protein [Vibrio sp. CK2-1]MCF7353834.1 hypothetical protein [Vibrio sp. CK2-1]